MNTENKTPKEIWIYKDGNILTVLPQSAVYLVNPKENKDMIKYLSESHHNEVVNELKAEIERLKSVQEMCQTYIPDYTSTTMLCMRCGKSQAFHPQFNPQ